MRRILVTGGAGFIGSNYVRKHLEANPDDRLVVLDRLTYAGNLQNLAGLLERFAGFRFIRGDVCAPDEIAAAFEAAGGPLDALVHFAAESHVDRSIDDAAPFVRTNVLGTQALLEAARRRGVGRFLLVSTDEVYGSRSPDEPGSGEGAPLLPNSPYAASKAAADCLARAYVQTFQLPLIISRASNNYGPHQFPEKFIPLFITNALEGRELPLYGDGENVRDWLHVDDHCDALEAILERGRPGEVYNVGGSCERKNLAVARAICAATGAPESSIRLVADRKGHDRRYALDVDKMRRELGWQPRAALEERLPEVVRWYQEHRAWWQAIKSGEYLDYYEKMYGARLRQTTAG